MLNLFLFFGGQLGEGLVAAVNLDKTAVELVENSECEPHQRPESVTSGEISLPATLEAAAAAMNVDQQQSPARSPHARSWTVPGVYHA